MEILHMTVLAVLLAAGRSGGTNEPNVIAARGAKAPNHSNVNIATAFALVRVMFCAAADVFLGLMQPY